MIFEGIFGEGWWVGFLRRWGCFYFEVFRVLFFILEFCEEEFLVGGWREIFLCVYLGYWACLFILLCSGAGIR